MKRILRNPITNAAGLSIFTAFYAAIFFLADFRDSLYYAGREGATGFWMDWSRFLLDGRQKYLALALIAVCAVTVLLLLTRRRAYDEYHTGYLMQCLSVATVLTLFFIAAFYLLVLLDPVGFVEKFTLFIAVHWTVVTVSDLAYVVACRWG